MLIGGLLTSATRAFRFGPYFIEPVVAGGYLYLVIQAVYEQALMSEVDHAYTQV